MNDGLGVAADDPRYERLRCEPLFNELVPGRRPRLIVEAHTEQDVIDAVRFARREGMRITVRGGGHSWVGFSLRDDAMLLDVSGLDAIAIDDASGSVTVQPGVHGADLHRALGARNLAFPIGHCPTVRLSGFLLSGGLGWNPNGWGPACYRIESANVVTAAGELVVADAASNPDLLWAVRGAGPGFFGVVTAFRLAPFPLPRAITSSAYGYPLPLIGDIGQWAQTIAPELPSCVELTVFAVKAPEPVADACRDANGFCVMLNATAFADDAAEAAAALDVLESCPLSADRLFSQTNERTPIDELLRRSGTLWPENHRYAADTLWSDSASAPMLGVIADRIAAAPSAQCLTVTVIATGRGAPVPDAIGAAFSTRAPVLTLCYAVWDDKRADDAHVRWHDETIRTLDAFAVGHYVGESDIVRRPERHARSYAPGAWRRLQSLRAEHDPTGLFCGPFGGD